MKIIEALKEIKRLEEKSDDMRKKVAQYCADLSVETPTYQDQAKQVAEWLQAAQDSLKQAEHLRIAIAKTNLDTKVTIEMGGNKIEKSIAGWIVRRRLYANSEKALWSSLTDRGLREGIAKNSSDQQVEVKIRRYYEPSKRDAKIAEYHEEPNLIDRTLEVINAVTEIRE